MQAEEDADDATDKLLREMTQIYSAEASFAGELYGMQFADHLPAWLVFPRRVVKKTEPELEDDDKPAQRDQFRDCGNSQVVYPAWHLRELELFNPGIKLYDIQFPRGLRAQSEPKVGFGIVKLLKEQLII